VLASALATAGSRRVPTPGARIGTPSRSTNISRVTWGAAFGLSLLSRCATVPIPKHTTDVLLTGATAMSKHIRARQHDADALSKPRIRNIDFIEWSGRTAHE